MAGAADGTGPDPRIGGAPPPSPARVEAIRDVIDLNDAALPATFGERARLEVLTLTERVLAETRAGDLGECTSLTAHIGDRLGGLNPEALLTRRGLAGWFDSRKKRLKAFREAFTTAAGSMSDTAGDLSDRAAGVLRRSQALEQLWVDIRAAISELDAYVAAGLERLAETGNADHPLSERLATLVAVRNAAIRQLPLVRLAQNADCAIPDLLKATTAAVSAWREEWREALGLNRRRPRRITPDQDWLRREHEALAAALDGAGRDLALAGMRRAQAATRMEQIAESVRRACPKPSVRNPQGALAPIP